MSNLVSQLPGGVLMALHERNQPETAAEVAALATAFLVFNDLEDYRDTTAVWPELKRERPLDYPGIDRVVLARQLFVLELAESIARVLKPFSISPIEISDKEKSLIDLAALRSYYVIGLRSARPMQGFTIEVQQSALMESVHVEGPFGSSYEAWPLTIIHAQGQPTNV